VCADGGHFGTGREVEGVVGGVVADVLGRSAGEEGVLWTGGGGGVEVDEAFMDALVFEEVEGEAGVVVAVFC